jgi:hypothetical protein
MKPKAKLGWIPQCGEVEMVTRTRRLARKLCAQCSICPKGQRRVLRATITAQRAAGD